MDLKTAFATYCDQAAFTQQTMRSIRSDASLRIQELEAEDRRREEVGKPSNYAVSFQNMSFRTAINGQHFFYSFQQHSIADKIRQIVHRTNRQYQWLLAEAYEHFEDFLECSYAAAALSDINHWPLRDYGELRAADLKLITFDWLLQQAKKKKDRPQSLLNPLRPRLPLIKRFESENAIDLNLWFCLHLIEQLRHHIVHTRGVVQSRDEFSNRVLGRCGLFNNGKPDAKYLEWINMYVRHDGQLFSIHLLEWPAASLGPISTFVCAFDILFNSLLAYAHLVASSFIHLESTKPPAA